MGVAEYDDDGFGNYGREAAPLGKRQAEPDLEMPSWIREVPTHGEVQRLPEYRANLDEGRSAQRSGVLRSLGHPVERCFDHVHVECAQSLRAELSGDSVGAPAVGLDGLRRKVL